MSNKAAVQQCGTGGLGSDPGDPERIDAPPHEPVIAIVAPHSAKMFDEMHGARKGRAPPGRGKPDPFEDEVEDFEDRLTGTDTLEVVLSTAITTGDDALVAAYADRLARHIEVHGLTSAESAAMTSAVQRRRAQRWERDDLTTWNDLRREASVAIVRAKMDNCDLTLIDALLVIAPEAVKP